MASSSDPLLQTKPSSYLLLALNFLLLFVGAACTLLLRLYFNNGGTRIWLSSLLQIYGWPLLIPLIFFYYKTNPPPGPAPRRHLSLTLFSNSLLLGLLSALNGYLYALGSSRLPLSTSSLIVSTQLVFAAVFAYFIIGQQFTAPLLNAVALLTMAPVVLSLGMASDMPEGETEGMYVVRFVIMLAAASLMGLFLPLVELAYRRTSVKITYGVVMEVMLAMGVSGTVFCLVGMVAANDFQAIPREAKEFALGEIKYNMILVWTAVLYQMLNLGLVGVISCASSVVGGIGYAILLPIGEVLAVMFLHEKFTSSKGVALALSLWGFASYLYGEKIQSQKIKEDQNEIHIPYFDET